MESGLEKAAAVRKLIESYSMTMRARLAERRVLHTCEALHRMGMKITVVDVYNGSLAKTLRTYEREGDTRLVVMPSGVGGRIMSFLPGMISLQSMFKRSSASSLLVLRSGSRI